jgi:outer membrane protein assembly factor BamB
MKHFLLTVCSILVVGHVAAAEIKLEQIISREDPAFQCERARLSTGRDGRVYLASGGTPSFVLGLDRDGRGKVGATVGYALTSAAANADGVVATSNAHFAHKVALYDKTFKDVVSVDDFLVNDQVGWDAPGHVEAGICDFFGLDQHRNRIVRLSAGGKVLRSYAIPHQPEGSGGQVEDFRVCEKRETFYLLARGGPLRCVGFDGTVRWTVKTEVSWGEGLNNGGFDVDDDGTLYTLGPYGQTVMRFAGANGERLQPMPLQLDDIKSELSEHPFCDLRVQGGDLFVRRRHPFELYRRYDRASGACEHAVHADHERLTAACPADIWTAGESLPFRVRLKSTGTTSAPRWRVWGRTAGARDYREMLLRDDAIKVPSDCAGLFQVFVTPDVLPGHPGATGDYRLHGWVEIRQPRTLGSATVLTPDNRTEYGRGEEVPFSVVVRARDADRPVSCTVRLVQGQRILAEGKVDVRTNGLPASLVLPRRLSAALTPGDYALTVEAPGLTGVPAPLTFGPGMEKSAFHTVQYGDYGPIYPQADAWTAPDVTFAHAKRTARLGFNLLVDRLGDPNQAGALNIDQWRAGLDPLRKRLEADPLAVAPAKAVLPSPLRQTLSAYSARGIEQMAILMMNDAGLPLGGPGFDSRKPEQVLEALTRTTTVLKQFPAFRGWSWASNWWVFQGRGAEAGSTPEEKAAYLAAEKRAKDTGAWDPVLDRVSGYRLGYAVDAQALFNQRLKEIAPGLVTAVASPYRNVESYPPVSLSNVDEVDLQAQWEQVALPYHAAHSVDFYKRPGKPAWFHPEVWNDAGTGDQIVPTLFQALMRGADGVGMSGSVPSWVQQTGGIPADPRLSHQGMTSVYRSLNALLRAYGPWLTTLRNNDRVAIVVSGRMMRTDTWGQVMGTYFARVLEAYCSCLHAHHPATLVFAEDLKPEALKKFAAVLVVGQRVAMEPALAEALENARSVGVGVFRDGTCRDGLVTKAAPLGISFDKFEKDPHPASDDAAYWRFPEYCRANVPALKAALKNVHTPGETENPEVFLSERRSEEGRFLFVVNNTTPKLEPGQLWRVSLCVATRVPVVAPVRLGASGGAVYDVFAGKRVDAKGDMVEADLRDLPARIFAVLPEAIRSVDLRGPSDGVAAGHEFAWSVKVVSDQGNEIRSSVPVRVQLRDSRGRILNQRFAAATAGGLTGKFTAPLNATEKELTLEATELFSGLTAQLPLRATALDQPVTLTAATVEPSRAEPVPAGAIGSSGKRRWAPGERAFGPHVRDITLTADGSLAVLNTMNWDHNLYGIDLTSGTIRWRQRVGHYFAFAPRPLRDGIAVQGFDFHSAEGYHLYLAGADGQLQRRFALYGLPKRLPQKFIPALLNDRINNFAVPADGGWVASAGDLGLAVWKRDGSPLWTQDWWKTNRHTATLAALDSDTLIVIEGMQATAYAARSGRRLWSLDLAATGEVRQVCVSADGKTLAVLASTAGGRVFVVRDGKVVATLLTGGNELAVSADGSRVAVAVGDQLKLYSVADGLRWVLPADDTLHAPRFSSDGSRLAVASELGTLSIVDQNGNVLLERDTGTIAVPAWLPDGDLLLATWAGHVTRLSPEFTERWSAILKPAATDMREALLADDRAPTTRITGWGNAEATPAPVTPNLLDPQGVVIQFRALSPHVQLQYPSAALVDGKADAPAAPWLDWGDVGNFAETSPFNYLLLDTYRTRLRVSAITLVEDPEHPESWLRDTGLEAWDATAEKWVPVQPLLSNAAVHTHKLAAPVEASRFRLVMPWGLYGNLRLAEIVLHGEKAGPAHPDAAARRPVAVLFDEGDELKDVLVGTGQGLSFQFGGAYSGGRYLKQEADRNATPPFIPPFGHVVPAWDFEIAEKPQPGQYRYAQFAWRALSPTTRGLMLQLDGDAYGLRPHYYAGENQPAEGALPQKLADSPPRDWQVVRVDLWEILKKPTHIRGLRLSAIGGPAGFDQILLGRAPEDLPNPKK